MYHQPYEEIFQRKPDFRVTYSIFTQEEGGRYSLPFQGIRWGFQYQDPVTSKHNLFMIWPEFEDLEGQIISQKNTPILRHGMAGMWIVAPERINYHRGKIKVGTHGFFMEGPRKVGESDVIELISLK